MPAKSQAQRGYLAANFGPAWMKQHHFDNPGKLPQYSRKKMQDGGLIAGVGMRRMPPRGVNPAFPGRGPGGVYPGVQSGGPITTLPAMRPMPGVSGSPIQTPTALTPDQMRNATPMNKVAYGAPPTLTDSPYGNKGPILGDIGFGQDPTKPMNDPNNQGYNPVPYQPGGGISSGPDTVPDWASKNPQLWNQVGKFGVPGTNAQAANYEPWQGPAAQGGRITTGPNQALNLQHAMGLSQAWNMPPGAGPGGARPPGLNSAFMPRGFPAPAQRRPPVPIQGPI